MSGGRPEFSIDDAFELSLEEGGPGPGGGPPRFGALHFERKGRGDAEEEGEKQSRLKYQNLENDEDAGRIPPDPDGALKLRDPGRSSTQSSQWSFSTISNGTQRSYRAFCSTHPHWGGTPGEPFSRCLQCHLLRSWLPAAHPRSVPRHLHLLGRQGPPRLPVLLLAVL
ncbi:transmembrane protein 134 isoform X4 [Gracilinanus agilis]|uniref:transmembrane protein 134 isoform X4 n=1 Tax=Gracilinanus agilis TaxID=191870 RepID=UPI001CFCFC9C|nr:transmembrane protein 134 isoform X4 [Gracilinanus agilis]